MICIASIVCLAALLSEEGLVLRDVRLISPERVGVLEEAFVVIQGGRITAVGTGSPPEEYHALPSLAGEGRWLVPGRIDAHVHLGDVNRMHQGAQLARPEVVAAFWAQLPRSFLYHGFTTLIELGGRSGAFDDLPAESPHPSLYDCYYPLVLANGYGMAFEPEATRFNGQPNFLWDERQGDAIPSRFQSEDHMPAACVARARAQGPLGALKVGRLEPDSRGVSSNILVLGRPALRRGGVTARARALSAVDAREATLRDLAAEPSGALVEVETELIGVRIGRWRCDALPIPEPPEVGVPRQLA